MECVLLRSSYNMPILAIFPKYNFHILNKNSQSTTWQCSFESTVLIKSNHEHVSLYAYMEA
jgi:hypothetical protein